MNTPAVPSSPQFPPILFYMCFSQAKSKWRGCFVGFFNKTGSAAALECCKKMLLIPETVVYPWRERLGEWIVFFPRCAALQSRVKQCLGFFIIFPWSFWSAFFLPFSTSTSSFSYHPWLRSRKQDWALFPDIQRNIKVRGNSVFCFAGQLGSWTHTRQAPAPRQGEESHFGATGQAIGQRITKSWSLCEFCLICLVGCMSAG